MLQAMLRRTLIVLPLISAAATCTAATADPSLDVSIDTASRLIPTHVRYAWTERGLELSGRIEKRNNGSRRIIGHVAIDLLDARGRVIGCHSGALQGFSPSRRNPDRASFLTVVTAVPPGLAGIRVRYALGSWC